MNRMLHPQAEIIATHWLNCLAFAHIHKMQHSKVVLRSRLIQKLQSGSKTQEIKMLTTSVKVTYQTSNEWQGLNEWYKHAYKFATVNKHNAFKACNFLNGPRSGDGVN